jgi:hypothetical protein
VEQLTDLRSRPVTGSGLAPVAIACAAAVSVGLIAGALTAYGQGWLADSVSSLVNSAGPWSLAAFLVARTVGADRLWLAMVTAVVTLACSEVGYAAATVLRGDANSTSTIAFWLTAAVLAGPPLGLAASWSIRAGWRWAAGCGALAGVFVGEGIYGWSSLVDTTEWRYWAAETAIGAVAAVSTATIAWIRRGLLDAVAAVAAAGATAVVVFAVARSS